MHPKLRLDRCPKCPRRAGPSRISSSRRTVSDRMFIRVLRSTARRWGEFLTLEASLPTSFDSRYGCQCPVLMRLCRLRRSRRQRHRGVQTCFDTGLLRMLTCVAGLMFARNLSSALNCCWSSLLLWQALSWRPGPSPRRVRLSGGLDSRALVALSVGVIRLPSMQDPRDARVLHETSAALLAARPCIISRNFSDVLRLSTL